MTVMGRAFAGKTMGIFFSAVVGVRLYASAITISKGLQGVRLC